MKSIWIGIRYFFLLLFVGMAALAFTGCHPSGKKQNNLRVNLYCEPNSLDPRLALDLTSVNVLGMLQEGLTRIGEDHLPKLALAESVHISEDGLTYTFHLREAFWSDGSLICAEDFVYAWSKILDPKYPSSFAYKLFIIQNAKAVKEGALPSSKLGIKAIDSTTLEVSLAYKAPYFLEILAFPTFFPVPCDIDLRNPHWADEGGSSYVCCGPFLLDSWDHENEIKVRANPTYWDRESVSLSGIDLVMINDTMTEYYMYENNELDVAGSPVSNLPFEVLNDLEQKGELLHLPISAIYYFKINTEVTPFTNRKIRQAFSYAINRTEIINHLLEIPQLAATSYVPPLAKRPTPLCCFEDGNEVLAKKLFQEGLKELNLSQSEFPEVAFLYNSNREHKRLAEACARQWEKALGVKIRLNHADWGVYLSKIQHKEYTIARAGWIGDVNDPISFLAPYKYKDDPEVGGNNNTGWENPTFQSLLDASDQEDSLQARLQLLEQAEKVMMEDMPVIPLYFITAHYVKKEHVKNIYYSRLGVVDFKRAQLL